MRNISLPDRGPRLRTALGAAALAAAALLGAAPAPAALAAPQQARTAVHGSTVVRDDLRALFDQAGVTGTFAMLDVTAGRTTVVDRARAERRMVPASTFKIPHSLIALETGVIEDENEVIPYGGEPQPFPQWEQDMNLRDAVAASNVPVFQTLARRIGVQRERHWLHRLNYGNRRTGTVVDRFWLDGPLKISAVEQTRFLSRLSRQALPASRRHQLVVRDILKVEETGDHALFAKTGWSWSIEPGIGWWAGWVERDGRTYAFALNLDVVEDSDTAQRVPLARELLRRLGVLPNG